MNDNDKSIPINLSTSLILLVGGFLAIVGLGSLLFPGPTWETIIEELETCVNRSTDRGEVEDCFYQVRQQYIYPDPDGYDY